MHRLDLDFDAEIAQFRLQLLRHRLQCRLAVTRNARARRVEQGQRRYRAAALATRLEQRNLFFLFDARAGFDLFDHRFDLDRLALFLPLLLHLENLLAFTAIALAFDAITQQVIAIDQLVDGEQA